MNRPVKLWFDGWAQSHRRACRGQSLPEPDSEDGRQFYGVLLKLFSARGITEEAAAAATERVVADPPPIRKHVGEILKAASEAMRAAGGEPTALAVDDTRESAEAASKGCPHCSGGGWADVRHRAPAETQRVTRTVAYCVCRFGRWLRTNHSRSNPDVFRRVPDLGDVIAGRSAWEQVSAPEESECRPPSTSTAGSPW